MFSPTLYLELSNLWCLKKKSLLCWYLHVLAGYGTGSKVCSGKLRIRRNMWVDLSMKPWSMPSVGCIWCSILVVGQLPILRQHAMAHARPCQLTGQEAGGKVIEAYGMCPSNFLNPTRRSGKLVSSSWTDHQWYYWMYHVLRGPICTYTHACMRAFERIK